MKMLSGKVVNDVLWNHEVHDEDHKAFLVIMLVKIEKLEMIFEERHEDVNEENAKKK